MAKALNLRDTEKILLSKLVWDYQLKVGFQNYMQNNSHHREDADAFVFLSTSIDFQTGTLKRFVLEFIFTENEHIYIFKYLFNIINFVDATCQNNLPWYRQVLSTYLSTMFIVQTFEEDFCKLIKYVFRQLPKLQDWRWLVRSLATASAVRMRLLASKKT